MSSTASPSINRAMPALDRLSPRRRRLAEEYGCDGNATQAAIRAGYSRRSARQQANVMLKDPRVRAAIAELRVFDLGSQNAAIARVQLIEKLAKIAHAKMSDYVDWGPDGVVLKTPLSEATDLPGVRRISVGQGEKGGRLSIEMQDRMGALNLLARIHGLLDQPVQPEPHFVAPPVYFREPVGSREEWDARQAALTAERLAQSTGLAPPALPSLLSGKLRRS